MRRSIWKCMVVLLLAVCMNMTAQAAYYAYTKTVKNQISLMEVSPETVNVMMFDLRDEDIAYTTMTGSNASESNASEDTASRTVASESNVTASDAEPVTSSDSNAEKK